MRAVRQLLLAKKSFMLEFVEGNTIKETWTFSIPPEGVEYDFGHRVAETKTFGGSIYDNYGNEAIHITLNGSTVNEDSKFIYRGFGQPPEYLGGEAEIWGLQERIYKWQDIHTVNSADGEISLGSDTTREKYIYLYDLSKMTITDMARGKPSRNWWRVVIKDFKIKQSKDRPLTYTYTLDMLALEDEKAKGKRLLEKAKGIDDALKAIGGLVKTIQTAARFVEGGMALADAVIDGCNTVKEQYKAIGEASGFGATGAVLQTIGGYTRIFSYGGGGSLYNSARTLMHTANILKYNIQEHYLKLGNWYAFGTGNEDTGDTTLKEELQSIYLHKPSAYKDGSDLTVTLDTTGGEPLDPIPIVYNDILVDAAIPTPTKDRHDFQGWYIDETTLYTGGPILKDTTLYAHWKCLRPRVIWYGIGSSEKYIPILSYTAPDTKGTIPPYSDNTGITICRSDRYEYTGAWYMDEANTTLYSEGVPLTCDTAIYAGRKLVQPQVTFSYYDGNKVTNTVATIVLDKIGDSVGKDIMNNIEVPTKAMHIFTGWYTSPRGGTIFDPNTPIKEDTTLYSRWLLYIPPPPPPIEEDSEEDTIP